MERIYISSDTTDKKKFDIGGMVLSAVALCGFMLLFGSFGCGAAQMIVGIVALLVLELTFKHRLLRTMLAVALIVAAFVFFSGFSNGMLTFLNGIFTLLNRRFSLRLSSFAADGSMLGLNIFFSVLFCAVAFLLTSLEKRGKTFVFGILLFLLFEFFVLLRVELPFSTVAVIIAAFAMCWTQSEMSTGSSGRIRWASGVLAATAAVAFCFAFSGFGGSEAVSRLSRNISESISDLRYGQSTLPEGSLRRAAAMESGTGEVLVITGESTDDEYLGGFTGSEYDSREGWSAHSGETFDGEWNGIFRWLNEQAFFPQNQYAKYTELTSQAVEAEPVTVKNKGGNRKYLYLPYSVYHTDKGRSVDDLWTAGDGLFGAGSYSFTAATQINPDVEIIYAVLNSSNMLIKDENYLKTEAVYAGFVDEVYKKTSPEDEALINEIFFSTDYLDENSGLYSVITRIRAVLELRATYTQTPPQYNSEKIFSDWFLNDSRRGNSAYYATIGALALRAAGFPARYTEGYYIEHGDAEQTVVTERNSHAWVEVYVDKAGWLPVEFTPGYYNSSLLSGKTVEISKDVAGGGSNEESPYTQTEKYNDPEADDSEEKYEKSPIFFELIVSIAAGLLILAFLFILLRAGIAALLRSKRKSSPDAPRYTYDYIFKMLSLGGVKCDKSRPEDCANDVVGNFAGIRVQEYMRMISLMRKNIFGGQNLNKAELRSLNLFCAKVRRLLYKKSGRGKQILLRFIYCV